MREAILPKAVAALGLLVAGCATTRLVSQVNRDAFAAPYGRILVIVALGDLELRQKGERLAARELGGRGVYAVPSHELFFPGKVYTGEEMLEVLRGQQIDGILALELADAGSSETYVPPTTYTRGTAWISRDRISGSSTAQTYGGYTLSKPWARFVGRLIDARSEEVVWVASAVTRGNAYAGGGTLLGSMTWRVVSQLSHDGMVPPPSRSR